MDASATHPSDRDLRAFGLGQLDDDAAEAVNSHLEGCPDCRQRVAALSPDRFAGRHHDAKARPTSLAPDISAGGPPGRGGGAAGLARPPVGPLPPGLADHPDYQILQELGRGGMAVVYLAHNTLMGRKEVLKVVSGDLVNRPGVLDRFLREIRSAARLHHPNIVTAYTALRLGESFALAMEYVEGLDLARLVKAKGPLPVANACHYVHQAALGLQHAHEHGMVHRDIKPANLILAGAGRRAIVKVLDFGLAKVSSEGQVDTSLTREGQMLGTPDYIAPEQIRDAQSADIRADIYSLGCTLYYLLSGRPPFGGDTLWDLYQAHFSMDAAPLDLVRPGVPAELAALLAKMMAKEPGRRFQSPGEIARALTPFFQGGDTRSVGSRPDGSREVRPEADVAQPGLKGGTEQTTTWMPSAPPPLPKTPAPSLPAPPSGEMPPESSAPPRNPAQPTSPGSVPEGLIDPRATRPTAVGSAETRRAPAARGADRRALRIGSAAIARLTRLGPRAWWTVAGVLLLGLAVVGAAIFPASTPARPMEPTITNSFGMRFTLIPDGTFLMGSPREDRMALPGEPPPHRERIARSFYMGINEVTRGQFRRFVEATGYTTDAEGGRGGLGCDAKTGKRGQDARYTWRDPGFPQTDEHPVVNVSWNDAAAFTDWLSRLEGKTYRLPTEAEWEYACRAGTTSRYSYGDDPEGLTAIGNCEDRTAAETSSGPGEGAPRDGYVYTAPVGRFRPNAYGLHDMHGNVWEWCSDEHMDGEYPLIANEEDPKAAFEPPVRAVRGGSWDDEPRRCRSASSIRHRRMDRSFGIGFRLVLVPDGH